MECSGCKKTTTGRQMYCQACFQCMESALAVAREEFAEYRKMMTDNLSDAMDERDEQVEEARRTATVFEGQLRDAIVERDQARKDMEEAREKLERARKIAKEYLLWGSAIDCWLPLSDLLALIEPDTTERGK